MVMVVVVGTTPRQEKKCISLGTDGRFFPFWLSTQANQSTMCSFLFRSKRMQGTLATPWLASSMWVPGELTSIQTCRPGTRPRASWSPDRYLHCFFTSLVLLKAAPNGTWLKETTLTKDEAQRERFLVLWPLGTFSDQCQCVKCKFLCLYFCVFVPVQTKWKGLRSNNLAFFAVSPVRPHL